MSEPKPPLVKGPASLVEAKPMTRKGTPTNKSWNPISSVARWRWVGFGRPAARRCAKSAPRRSAVIAKRSPQRKCCVD